MDMATKVMALELGPHKVSMLSHTFSSLLFDIWIMSVQIRVNAVNPTVVLTAMGKKAWSDPVRSSEAMSKIPLGRFAGIVCTS